MALSWQFARSGRVVALSDTGGIVGAYGGAVGLSGVALTADECSIDLAIYCLTV